MRGRRSTAELRDLRRINEGTRAVSALLRNLPEVQVHNRLMTVSDRSLALALIYLDDSEREIIFRRLAPSKSERVQQEQELHSRLGFSIALPAAAIDTLHNALLGTTAPPSGTYLRPRRVGTNRD